MRLATALLAVMSNHAPTRSLLAPAKLRLRPLPLLTVPLLPRLWAELAIQDWIVLAYLGGLFACTALGQGPRRSQALVYLAVDCAIFVTGIVLARGGVARGLLKPLAYRLGLFGGVLGSFLHLQYILPTASSRNLDAALYALDLRLFGVEPSIAFDRFVSTATTEWFAFFYFTYFFLLAVHVLPFLFAERRMHLLSELALGVIGIACVGHLLYIVVPGHGPYRHLASAFEHDLTGPVWWRAVKATVDSADVASRTDIFPSLHTAFPTFFALFAFRHRADKPFRYVWPLLAFAASQIVVSTMFLRWHYLIDVVAGLALAGSISCAAPRIARWELHRRARAGRQPVWTEPWAEGHEVVPEEHDHQRESARRAA